MATFARRLFNVNNLFYSKVILTRTSTINSPVIARYSTKSEANKELLKSVNTALKFEREDFQVLPEVVGFSSSTEGAVAMLKRKFMSEEVTVTMDVNSAMQLDMDEEELGEDSSAPTFTVSVTKPSGNGMQFDCSFDVTYDEASDSEELRMNIDTVSVVPSGAAKAESIYCADGEQMEKELMDGFEEYLAERGINNAFGAELVNFYHAFEHKVYVTDFLEGVKNYISE